MRLPLDPFPAWVRQLLQTRTCKDVVDLVSDYSHHEVEKKETYLAGPFQWETFRQIDQWSKAYSFDYDSLSRDNFQACDWPILSFLFRLAGSQIWVSHVEVRKLYDQMLANPPFDYLVLRPEHSEWLKLGWTIYQVWQPNRIKTPEELLYYELRTIHPLTQLAQQFISRPVIDISGWNLFRAFPFPGFFRISGDEPADAVLEAMATAYAGSDETKRQVFCRVVHYHQK